MPAQIPSPVIVDQPAMVESDSAYYLPPHDQTFVQSYGPVFQQDSQDESGLNSAVSNGGLTLQMLQAQAVVGNPSIQRVEALVQAARGRALQVGLKANPNVGIDFQQLGSDGQAEQYGVFVEQEFIRREKRSLSRSVVLQEVRRLQQQWMTQRQRVMTDVEIAFMRVLRAQRQIDVTTDLVELSEKALNVAKQLFEAKEVSRSDVLQAELEVQAANILLVNAKNRHTAAWRTLSAVANQPLMVAQPIAGDLMAETEELDFDASLARLYSSSPEIRSAQTEIERARTNVCRQKVEPLPNLTVAGLINWRDNGASGDPDGGLVVSIPLPVHDRNQGAICEAQQQWIAAQRALEQLRWQLQQRLVPVFERYRNAKEQSERYKNQILPKAAETLTLTRETYELGEVNFINLLTAQRTYAQTQLAYIESLESLRIAEAEINGMLLLGSLEANPGS
ncbi:TolC family protein [Novipirellula artificiosorum]|uniref:TolC family protein n=1 Tax=Novipirellula artificiosorum TaxID=2528016 RepID=UPI0018CE8B9A|nr:TolC family protein [Novipirellula artificiosorum]